MSNYSDTDTWGIDTRGNLSTSGEENKQFDNASSIFQAILDSSPNAGYVPVYRNGVILQDETQVLINSRQIGMGEVKNASYANKDDKLRVGDIITWREDKFLCVGWENKEVQVFHNSINLHLCNKILTYTVISETPTTEKGLYGETINNISKNNYTVDCVYDSRKLDYTDEQLVNLPIDKLSVEVQYNSHYDIDMDITIDDKPYKIYGIDSSYTKLDGSNNRYGVLILDLKIRK